MKLWVSYGILRSYTCTRTCAGKHRNTCNLEWTCVAFAYLYTIYPFLIAQPFFSGIAGLSTEVVDHLPLGGHMIPAILTMALVQKCPCNPIRAKVLSETATYSLYVNVGSICISKACPLIQKMMLSLLPAPLGGSENKLKQSSKGARIQGCSLTISCSLDLFGKLSFSRTPSISRIEILLHDVNN